MLLPPLLGFECDGDVNGGVGERAGRSRCAVSSRFIKVLRWVKRSLAAREALHCWLMKVNSVVFRAGLADSRFPRVR